MLERACSWFQIQEVAHPQLGAKARSIWEWMQKALAGTGKQPRPSAEEGPDYKATVAMLEGVQSQPQAFSPESLREISRRAIALLSPAAHTAQVTARLSSAPWRVVKGKENVGHGWPVAFMGCDHNGDNWYIETHGVHASEAVSEPENDAKAIVAWRNSLAEQGSGAKEYKEGDK